MDEQLKQYKSILTGKLREILKRRGFVIIGNLDESFTETPIYIQIGTLERENTVILECVSNYYLPEDWKISTREKLGILSLNYGFDVSVREENYSKEYILNTESDLVNLADIVFSIFNQVYDLATDSKYTFQVNFDE